MTHNLGRYSIQAGRVVGVEQLCSPNCGDRPAIENINLLVIHNISLPPGEYGADNVKAFFTNSLDSQKHPYFKTIDNLCVSAHLLVERSGKICQFVGLNERAWHAGESCFSGVDNCNDYSIGIELEGTDTDVYTDAQYLHLAALCRVIMAEYPHITMDRIVGHSDIAPGRKTDPGSSFEWTRLRSLLENQEEK